MPLRPPRRRPPRSRRAARQASSSIRMDTPTWRARHRWPARPSAWVPQPTRARRGRSPSTKPIGSPTTGTTKKPTTPSTPPTSSVRLGMPSRRSRRPGTRYFTTVPMSTSTAATANTTQPVVVDTSSGPGHDRGDHQHGSRQHRARDADDADGDHQTHHHVGPGHPRSLSERGPADATTPRPVPRGSSEERDWAAQASLVRLRRGVGELVGLVVELARHLARACPRARGRGARRRAARRPSGGGHAGTPGPRTGRIGPPH